MDLMLVIGLLVFLVCSLVVMLILKNFDLDYDIIEAVMDVLRKDPELKELLDSREDMIKHALPDELKKAYDRYINTPDPKPKKKDKTKKKGKKKSKKGDGVITMTPEQWDKAQEKPKDEKKKEGEVKHESESPKEERKTSEPKPDDKSDDKSKDKPSTTEELDEELKKLEKDLSP